jgi:hypothetical protein
MKKILLIGMMMIAIALAAVTLWRREQQERTTATADQIASHPHAETQSANHNHEAKSRVPAHFNSTPSLNTLRGTLAPELFAGNVRLAYQVAKDIPQTLAQMPCYCHCDMSQGHKSLHSCFEDEHGANCGVCIGEALMAYNLQQRGLKPSQIRERLIVAYGTESNK